MITKPDGHIFVKKLPDLSHPAPIEPWSKFASSKDAEGAPSPATHLQSGAHITLLLSRSHSRARSLLPPYLRA